MRIVDVAKLRWRIGLNPDNSADGHPRAMAAVETQGQDDESGDRPIYGFQRG